MALPDMTKHRGFPSRLPGTDFQFTIRRANKDGAVKLVARERFADRRPGPTAAPMPGSWRRCGPISAKNRSKGATWTPAASHGCSGARSCPPRILSTRKAMKRCCELT